MLKPTSRVNMSINEWASQKKEYMAHAEDALLNMIPIIAKLTSAEPTKDDVQGVADSLKSTYYNQFTSGDIIYDETIAPEDAENILDDASFYVTIAKSMPDTLTYVMIGGVQTDNDDVIRVSIGNNAWIKALLWKINDDGELMVAVPYLYSAVDLRTGYTAVVAGGITYNIEVADPIEGTGRLTISDAWIQEKDDCAGSIKVVNNSINMVVGHKDQAAGIILNDANGVNITDTDTTIFVMMDDGSVIVTTLQEVDGNEPSYVWYTIPWADAAVEADETGRRVHFRQHIVVPGYGILDIKVHAVLVGTDTDAALMSLLKMQGIVTF